MTQRHIPLPFIGIADSDEEFIWHGRPELLPYLTAATPYGATFIVAMVLYLYLILRFRAMDVSDPGYSSFVMSFTLPVLIIALLCLVGLVKYLVTYRYLAYAITNKRIIVGNGFWGYEFLTIDFDHIPELRITVNFIESRTNTGTITMQPDTDTATKVDTLLYIRNRFISIRNPYQVYQLLKETIVDVKTDWNYPNAIRPEENLGYRTRYHPQKREL